MTLQVTFFSENPGKEIRTLKEKSILCRGLVKLGLGIEFFEGG
jgi:hypothetical protein